jgi:hypothetical protein
METGAFVTQANTSAKKLVAEFLGTAFLLMAVVGSGIMADTLSSGNVSLALLENTIAKSASAKPQARAPALHVFRQVKDVTGKSACATRARESE